MNITYKRRIRLLASLLMLAIVSLACTLTSGTANTPAAPTQAAAATATLAPATATPVPPTPRPTVDRTAEAQRLTAEAFSVQQESVRAELRELGLPADGGKLEWFSDTEILLRTVDYQGLEFHTLPVSDAANFVLKVDIIWDTTSGLAGCALPFRAAGDFKNEPTYMLMMMRLSGAPAWDIEFWEYGLSQRMVRAAEFTDSIDDRAGRKNTLVLVAQDNEFSVFINGDKMSTARDARLTSGQIGFAAWQESGETTCGFSNAWLWTFDE